MGRLEPNGDDQRPEKRPHPDAVEICRYLVQPKQYVGQASSGDVRIMPSTPIEYR
jgi:hypothetical protein